MVMKKKNQRKRRVAKKRGPSNKTLSKEVRNIKNNLIELKFNDFNATATTLTTAFSTSSAAVLLANVSTEEARVGNVINPTSLLIRMKFTKDPARLVDEQVRFLMLWDKQANGAVPTILGAGGVLDSTLITDPILAPHNFDTNKRFTILMDKVYRIPAGGAPIVQSITNNTSATATVTTTQITASTKYVRIYRKLGRAVKYIDSGATITSVMTNSLIMAWVTDAGASGCTLDFGARLYYRDA